MVMDTSVIFVGDPTWQIGTISAGELSLIEVSIPPNDDPSQVVGHLLPILKEHGHPNQSVVLAVPSDACLCAAISTQGLPRKKLRQAMNYRLEEKLPVAAEEIVADFVSVNGQALGVCIEPAKIAPIVEALEQAGVAVELVCPTAILALQGRRHSDETHECNTLIWGHKDHLELFTLADSKPKAWRLLAQSPDDLAIQLGMQIINHGAPLRIEAYNVGQPLLDRIADESDIQIVASNEESMLTAATRGADQILTGKTPGWINLRRDALGAKDPMRRFYKPLQAAVIAGLVFLACSSVAMLWRANRYEQIASQAEAQQRAIFEDLFPNQTLPISVKSRLASEQRRLRDLFGVTSQRPRQTSSLLALRDLLTQIPTAIRYRLLEIRLTDDRLYLDGQTRTHSDADAIVASLNKHRAFNIEPPRTETLAGKGIAFTIIGVINHTASDTGGHP